jgi:hypothetical protein
MHRYWVPLAAFLLFSLTSAGGLVLDARIRLEVAQHLITAGHPAAPTLGRVAWQGTRYEVYGIGQSLLLLPGELLRPVATSLLAERAPRAMEFFYAVLIFPALGAAAIAALIALAKDLGATKRAAEVYGLLTAAASPFLIYGADSQEVSQIVLLLALGLRWLLLGKHAAGALCLWSTTLFRPIHGLDVVAFGVLALYLRPGSFRPLLLWGTVGGMIAGGWYFAFNAWRFGSPSLDAYAILFRQWGMDPFSYPALSGLLGPLFSPDKSLLLYAPLLAAVPWAFSAAPAAVRGIVVASALALLASVLFFSRYAMWAGDHAVGPRFQMHLVPLLLLPIAFLRPFPRPLAALAVAGALVALAQASLAPGLEIVQNPNRVEGTVERSPIDPPGRWAKRFVNVGTKLAGEDLLPSVRQALRRTPSSYETSLTEWDFYWTRAAKEGRAIGLLAVALAVLQAAGLISCLILWKREPDR